MPAFSVLIHAESEAHHLGRLLETLRPADEVVVVDHTRREATRKVTQEYGARLVPAVPGVDRGAYAVDCRHDWILCLQATESLSEELEASLFEWKQGETPAGASFCIAVREQEHQHWHTRAAETRLVNRTTVNWQGALPPHIEDATPLIGHLLRFAENEAAGRDPE